ncbi:RND family transporter, partial [Mycobacterium alsense]|uniref:MMPL/RND family transporter n=1 Tax=Mycobacterium alsense TaxID=324058 RepID=UPI0009ED3C99
MSNDQLHDSRPLVARTIRRFSVPIILAWLAIIGFLIVCVPSLEQVESERSVSLNPTDAPSVKASQRMNEDFKSSDQSGRSGQSDSGSLATIVLEGQQPLGDDAHRYYDRLVSQLKDDPKHVAYVQDFWGDELTRHAAQSVDGKAAYVQVVLAKESSQNAGNDSVAAVQRIVARTPAPPGVKAYVTGPAAINADMSHSGDRTVATITAVSVAVIFITLLLVYRSVVTAILLLVVVGVELQVARGFVAFIGHHGAIGLTTFAVNLLVSLVIAAGTDYGIFFIGRYQEALQVGADRETAYYTTYHGVAKVVVASGLTIAGALFCLIFTRLPSFYVLAIPCAVGVLVAVAVAVTLIPAVLTVGSRFGLFEPRRKANARTWRRVGTAIVRWPAPILVATLAVTLLGLLTLPGYKPSYNDQKYIPKDIPANMGYEAAARHFPPSTMMSPEILLVETDHDLRNSADFLVLEKLAKAVLAVPGISSVQAVTRPEGTPIKHTTLPYLLSMQVAGQQQFLFFQKARLKDMLKQADMLAEATNITRKLYSLTQQMVATTHDMVGTTRDIQDLTNELRVHISDFEDFFRPIRSYFYWEKHCYDIPICFSLRSIFDSLDGVDAVADKLGDVVADLGQIDMLLPQIVAQFPEMIAIMESSRTMLLTMHSTMSGVLGNMGDDNSNANAMGRAFDTAQNDDS